METGGAESGAKTVNLDIIAADLRKRLTAEQRRKLAELLTTDPEPRPNAVLGGGPAGKIRVPEARRAFERCQRQPRADAVAGFHNLEAGVIAAAASAIGCDPSQLGNDDGPNITAGWDSFAHAAFVIELEVAFSIRITVEDFLALTSIGASVRVIRNRLHTTFAAA